MATTFLGTALKNIFKVSIEDRYNSSYSYTWLMLCIVFSSHPDFFCCFYYRFLAGLAVGFSDGQVDFGSLDFLDV